MFETSLDNIQVRQLLYFLCLDAVIGITGTMDQHLLIRMDLTGTSRG